MKSKLTYVAVVVLGAAGCAESTQSGVGTDQAQAQALSAEAGAGEGRRHHGPPPEAFTACEAKALNDACTVAFGDKTIAGKCLAPPPGAPDARNVCVPNDRAPHGGPGGPGGPPHHPPPPAAFDACNGKTAEASCTVALGDRTVEGKCIVPPPGANETRLLCAPPHLGPPGGPPPVHP